MSALTSVPDRPADKPTDPFGILGGPADAIPEWAPLEEEETKILGLLQEYFNASEQARSPFESEWDRNKLMLAGEQMIVHRPNDTEVLRVVPERDSRRKYSIDNQLRTTARAFVGKACRIIPGVAVLPASHDRSDILAAENMKAYLDWWSESQQMRRKYKRAWDLLPPCGNAFFQLRWDRAAGEDVLHCAQCGLTLFEGEEGEPCMLCMMQGIESPLIKIKSGGVTAEVLQDHEFFPEPGVIDITKMQRCHTRIALPVARIRELFPERGMLVHSEDNLYKDRYLTYNTNMGQARFQTEYVEGYTQLYTYYEMPSGENPEGLIIRVASDRILQMGPNPYVKLLGRLPFFQFRGDSNPGAFYGVPIISEQASLQREYNILTTQMREWRELVVRPQMFSYAHSGVRTANKETGPGYVWTVRPGHPQPDYIRPPTMPNFVLNEQVRLKEAIREKALLTAHDVGEVGDNSGRAMALLSAQSNELFGPLLVENMPEWLSLHKSVLVLAQHFDPPEKRWVVTGQDRFTVHTWDSCHIKGGWDVTAADEDSLSRNPELRRQQALEQLAQGVYTDPKTGLPNMKRFMADAGLRQPGAGVDSEASERIYAAQIGDRLARGEQIMPELFDDANIHAEELLNWLRGRGRMAPPQVKAQVIQRWLQYAMVAMPAPDMAGYMPNPGILQMAFGAQQGPGGPGGPGGPPQPGQGPAGPQPQNRLTPGGTGRLPQAAPSAGRMIHNADRAGEVAARGNRPHEG